VCERCVTRVTGRESDERERSCWRVCKRMVWSEVREREVKRESEVREKEVVGACVKEWCGTRDKEMRRWVTNGNEGVTTWSLAAALAEDSLSHKWSISGECGEKWCQKGRDVS